MSLTDEQQRRVNEAVVWFRKPPGDVIYDGPYSQVEVGKLHVQKLITIIRELAEPPGPAEAVRLPFRTIRERREAAGLPTGGEAPPPFGGHSFRCDDARRCSFRENGYCTICCLKRDDLCARVNELGVELEGERAKNDGLRRVLSAVRVVSRGIAKDASSVVAHAEEAVEE